MNSLQDVPSIETGDWQMQMGLTQFPEKQGLYDPWFEQDSADWFRGFQHQGVKSPCHHEKKP